MIVIKGTDARAKIREAGKRLANLFCALSQEVRPGLSTALLDKWIEQELDRLALISQTKGYRGYRHVSCISVNDELVHGVPSTKILLKDGDLVKIDICAAWSGY
ncbi:MAG: M24 family metallopeptidase, partial [Cyanobacteriota bacterium]